MTPENLAKLKWQYRPLAPSPVLELIEDYEKLLEELRTTDWLLNERQKLLTVIPECEMHGLCVPHALEWVKEAKKKIIENEQLQAELAELKPQAMLLRRFLNNSTTEVERLAEENRRLHIEMEKQK